MLQFFHKYQKFFFLFTTIIVVSSFVFFGTYQAFGPNFKKESDEVAFVAMDGKKVRSSYLNAFSDFISSEGSPYHNKILSFNFLNDSVITREFLESGLAARIVAHFSDELEEELQSRLDKEKKYRPYVHPYFKSLCAESIWKQYAPEIAQNLLKLQKSSQAVDLETFETKVNLFLAEKKFPPTLLGQVLRYQEKDYSTLPPDPRLMKDDLRLFGYRDLRDWFGSRFIDSISQIIINTAALARQAGYRVTREEVLSDLLYRSEQTFDLIKNRTDLPVDNGYGLFQLYLRQKGIDEVKVVKVWEDVTLFRRLFHELGEAAFIDALPLQQFYNYAHEYLNLDLFQMPSHLRFQTLEELAQFEAYLDVTGEKRSSMLDLPLTFLPLEDIESRAPELVGKEYQLYVMGVTTQALEAKVNLKQMLEWEHDAQNWEKLASRFPELAEYAGTPFEALESVNSKGRKAIDSFARQQIVESHPEWIEEAMKNELMEEKKLFLTSKTRKPLPGITDPIALGELLDRENELIGYTQDGMNYYRILVKERSSDKEIMTYKRALQEKVLEEIAERVEGENLAKKVMEELSSALNLENLSDEERLPYRFATYLAEYRETQPEGDLAKQWKVEKTTKTLTRSQPSFISFDEASSLDPAEVSEVKAAAEEGAYFYCFLDKQSDVTPPLGKIRQNQELLSREVRQHYLEKVIAEMKEKKAFVFN
ncbi:MAG: hypothetical protein WAM28_09140 [Chlamydiales bacterium]